MRKIIEERKNLPSPEVLQGFKDLLKVYSPSCVVTDAQERAGVMRSYLTPIDKATRFAGPALTVRLEPGNQVDCLDALSVAQPGDVIVVRDKSKKLGVFHDSMRKIRDEDIYPWLTLEKAQIEGTFVDYPNREDIPIQVQENLIVELYSK